MPIFKLHLHRRDAIEADEDGIEFRDFHHAYLETCKAIPETARDLLIDGQDPMVCAYVIHDDTGQHMMDVPFAEILSASEYRAHSALHGPACGARSE